MAIQFSKNQTFALRSVSLYDSAKQYRTEDGTVIHKAGEPTAKGKVYPDHTEVFAIESFKGGGFICKFPEGELAYVDSNKIWGNEGQYVAKKAAAKATTNGNGHGAKAVVSPLERVKLLKQEKEALEMRLLELSEELPAAIKAMQTVRAEEDAILADSGVDVEALFAQA